MKAKDEFRTSSLRMLKTSLKNAQVEKMHELSDEEAQSVIASLVRKGQEAAAEFRKGTGKRSQRNRKETFELTRMIQTPGHVHAEHLLLNILSFNAAALIEQQSSLSLIRILTESKCYRRCRKWVIETFTAPVQRKRPCGH